MNETNKTDQATKALPCIVALLFSLAVTAEIASALPAPLRRTVLLILLRAEALAYSYVYWRLYRSGLSLTWGLPDECRDHFDPEAALSLASWFRILALALRDLPRRAFAIRKARMGWRFELTRINRLTGRAGSAARPRVLVPP